MISSCIGATKVQYEKTNVHSDAQWTPVFESSNKGHKALHTGSVYTLVNRNQFGSFQTKTLLYITPLIPKDAGKWKCTVYCQNKEKYQSDPLDVKIYVPQCKPDIVVTPANKLEIDGHASLHCDIASCDNMYRVIFEKTDPQTPKEWIPVFEATDNHANRFNTSYMSNTFTIESSISNSTLFKLNIEPLNIKHEGQWRCVVYGHNDRRAESDAIILRLALPIIVPSIRPYNPALVTNQSGEFTCIAEGVYPEPDVTWKLNGEDYIGGKAGNIQHDGGLWFVMNSITLHFQKVGGNTLSCVMKIRSRSQLLQNHLLIDVKEPARVLHPEEVVDTTGNSNTVSLNCTGSGYKPKIQWTRNGEKGLDEDERYHIDKMCNLSYCSASLTINPIPTLSGCLDMAEYSGIYKCVISLEEPYQSTQVSPTMIVYMQDTVCVHQTYIVNIVVIPVLVCIVVLVSISGPLICVWKKKRQDTYASSVYAEVGDVVTSPPLPLSSGGLHIQHAEPIAEYAELNDLIANPVASAILDQIVTDTYSYCSVSDKESEHSYDVCSTGECKTKQNASEIVKEYPQMNNESSVAFVSKGVSDVVYKRIDGQGHTSYVTKEELLGNEYIPMGKPERVVYVNSDAPMAYNKTGKGSPKYINRDQEKHLNRLNYRDRLVPKAESLHDVINN